MGFFTIIQKEQTQRPSCIIWDITILKKHQTATRNKTTFSSGFLNAYF